MAFLLTRKRVVGMKIEGTSGTAEVLADADGAENCFDPTYEGDIPSYERQGQLTLSALPSVPGAQSGKFGVRTEIYNNGNTTPLWASCLLVGSGMANSNGTYSPSTGSLSTLTLGHFVNGNLWEICGAQGTFKIMADKVGEPVKMQSDFTGVYVPNAATALIAPTFPTVKPPRFAGATLSLGAIVMVVKKFELDIGNKVTLRESAATSTGYLTAIVTERTPKLTMTVEVPAIGTHDYYNDLITSVQSAFSCAIGSGSGNIVTIAAPKCQLRSAPKLSDADGILTYDLEFGLNRNTSAGDDEFTIALS